MPAFRAKIHWWCPATRAPLTIRSDGVDAAAPKQQRCISTPTFLGVAMVFL